MRLPSVEPVGMVLLEQDTPNSSLRGSGMTVRPRAKMGARQRNARRKRFLIQAIAILAMAILMGVLVRNTVVNLQARGLASGFDFLWREAGFKMAFSLIPVGPTSTYGRIFLAGLLNSILVAMAGIVAATVLGFVIGIARASSSVPVRLVARAYVEVVRNLPLLLHLLLWQTVILRSLPTVRQAIGLGDTVFLSNRGLYLPTPVANGNGVAIAIGVAVGLAMAAIAWRVGYSARREGEPVPRSALVLAVAGLVLGGIALTDLDWQVPVLAGFDFRGGVKLMPELVSLVAALAIYNAAFIGEIVRAGIESVPPGQREAAAALGLPPRLILRLVVVPQALRVMVPPIGNQYTHIIKASSLATVVGFPDLVSVFLGTSLNQTGRAIEIVAMTALVYLVLCMSVALATGLYNRRVMLVER